MKLTEISIPWFLANYPDITRFTVYRVSDEYLFTVAEIHENTLRLNSKVNITINKTDPGYRVHPMSIGRDFEEAKIKRYVEEKVEEKRPCAVNLKKELTTRLHEEPFFMFGRILSFKYYPYLEDNETPDMSDLIAEKIFDYNKFAPNREVLNRIEYYRCYDERGEVCDEKILPKKYVGHQGMAEAKRRRTNIIEQLKHELDQMGQGGGEAAAIATAQLIGELDPYLNLYEKYGSFAILDAIDASTNVILTAELKAYMKGKMNFLAYEKNEDGSYKTDIYKGSLL